MVSIRCVHLKHLIMYFHVSGVSLLVLPSYLFSLYLSIARIHFNNSQKRNTSHNVSDVDSKCAFDLPRSDDVQKITYQISIFHLPQNSDRHDCDMIEIHMQTAPKICVCGGAPKKPISVYLDIEMN